jgi:glutathione synthase/RimK-type ligase-like ATP-grasp enzyme
MSAVNLRDDVEQRCRALIHTLGLSLAGIDLKLDRHGQWWCLEVNTVPGFIWFENHIGLPITDAVANLLVNGAKTDQHRLPPGASPARPAPGISL